MAGLSNEPEMKIRGQINKALEGIRECLVNIAEDDNIGTTAINMSKARYTLKMAEDMCLRYRRGINTPWREFQPMISEEFS